MGRVTIVGGKVGMTVPKVGLPSGYTELMYIESTGTQYVDTEFKPNQDTKIEVSAAYTGTHSSSFYPIWSTRTAYKNGDYTFFRNEATPTQVEFCYGAKNAVLTIASTNDFEITLDKNSGNINGTAFTMDSNAFQCVHNLFLFGMNDNGTATRFSYLRIKKCKIYDNENLVRDFIPCINADGDIGLYDAVNKKFHGNSGTGTFKCDLDFATCTWEQVITRCKNNTVPIIWEVGSQKTMAINGTDYLIDIIGNSHDVYSDGSGTAPLTFMLHDCYGTTYAMNNNSNTNVGGWESCAMRVTHLPAILALMPSEVQSGIKKVNKLTSAGNTSSTINTIEDDLFLLSEIEIFGTITFSKSGEGKQYSYYASGNSKVKNINGSASSWWTRSPRSTDSTTFCNVYTNGTADASSAGGGRGVSFAFCF